jgi:YHS domain-containing protein
MKPILFAALCLVTNLAFAQKIIEKKFPWSSAQTANLNLKFADSIQVRYWDKAEVSVRIAVVINNGRLNDALTVESGSTADEITLKTDFDKEMLKKGKMEDCPGEKSKWRTEHNGSDYYVCSKINYQVYLPRNAKLKLETINGNIDIKGASAPVFAKTISGYVDFSWPKSKGANLAMKTITGEVYTDLDIDFKNKKQKNPIVGYLLEGTINGGGPEVRLESISNNVYLRKN